jgi:hypothetical protein
MAIIALPVRHMPRVHAYLVRLGAVVDKYPKNLDPDQRAFNAIARSLYCRRGAQVAVYGEMGQPAHVDLLDEMGNPILHDQSHVFRVTATWDGSYLVQYNNGKHSTAAQMDLMYTIPVLDFLNRFVRQLRAQAACT